MEAVFLASAYARSPASDFTLDLLGSNAVTIYHAIFRLTKLYIHATGFACFAALRAKVSRRSNSRVSGVAIQTG
jgi:hypothetical protein